MVASPVSIVVPCYGRARQTRDLLESLEQARVTCQIVIVDDASRVIPLERAWVVDPSFLFGLLGALAVGLALWWFLARRQTAHRRKIRNLNRLGEELLAAKSM